MGKVQVSGGNFVCCTPDVGARGNKSPSPASRGTMNSFNRVTIRRNSLMGGPSSTRHDTETTPRSTRLSLYKTNDESKGTAT